MKKLVLICAFIAIAALSVSSKDKPETVKLDTVVKNFSLKDVKGKSHALQQLSEKKTAVVVLFLATQCPIATDYAERIVALVDAYAERDVQFVGINSNRQETVEEIAEYSKKHGFEFPVLKDPGNKIADYFAARRTPEVFLLDKERVLRYRGAIDDKRDEPTKHYLQTVLDLILAGQEVPEKSRKTRAVGCTIKRVRKTNVDRTP